MVEYSIRVIKYLTFFDVLPSFFSFNWFTLMPFALTVRFAILTWITEAFTSLFTTWEMAYSKYSWEVTLLLEISESLY